jgi:hypothetical protein
MEQVPYLENSEESYFIRTFNQNTPSDELKWHFDDENRKIIPVSGHCWQIQIDNSIPEDLVIGNEYFIPVDVYHRIIKGEGDLVIKLYKLDSDKTVQPKYVRKYTDNPNFSDCLLYNIQKGLKIQENVFRYGSEAWCDLINEVQEIYSKGLIELDEDEIEFLKDEPGKIHFENGKRIILNTPFRNPEENGLEFYVDVLDEGVVKRLYFGD